MNASDDYPLVEGPTARSVQRREMLDEIDMLRRDVCLLLALLASAELKLRIAADPNASLWTNP